MIEATMTLPAPDVMIEQLKTIDLDPHVSGELYQKIAAGMSGQEVVVPGLVMGIMSDIRAYARDNGLMPFTLFMITDFMPQIIEALTHDHPEVRQDALSHWEIINPFK